MDYRCYIFCFDPDDCCINTRMEVLRRHARKLVEIMNGGRSNQVSPDGASWRVADPGHASFGQEVPASVIYSGEYFITWGKVGLVVFEPDEGHDREWVCTELVTGAQLHAWQRAHWPGAGRDPRLNGVLGVSASALGARYHAWQQAS